jgi:hypothetical protein
LKTTCLIVLAAALFGAAACGGRDGPSDGSPGVRSTAYLPPSPNEAGTGTHELNSSFAVVGGQTTDPSNPTPSGLPGVSPALN